MAAPPVNFGVGDESQEPWMQAAAQRYLNEKKTAGGVNSTASALQATHYNDPTSLQAQMQYVDLQNRASGGWNPYADANMYQFGGDPNYAMNERNRFVGMADAAGGRAGPTADTSQMSPWMDTARQAQGGLFDVAGQQGNVAANQGYVAAQQGGAAANLGQAATGEAFQGQMGAAGQLAALGQLPAGPSAAEMAMRRNTSDALQNQASLAASARGGNSALALYGAGLNEAKIGGDSTLAIGQQRASEDLANRTFAANALQGAGGMYGNAMQGQVSAYGAQSGALGNQSSAFGNQSSAYGAGANAYNAAGGLGLQGAGQYGNIATANLGAETNQRGLNDQTGLAYNTLGNQMLQTQTGANEAFDQARTGNYLGYRANEQGNADKTGRGTITGSAGTDKAIGTGLTVAGTAVAMTSDIRAKKSIKPAAEDVSNAFRTAAGNADTIRGIDVVYPDSIMSPVPVTRKRSEDAGMARELPATATPMAYQPTPMRRSEQYGLAQSMDGGAYSPYSSQPIALARENPYTSDIRNKTAVAPAADAVSDAFRQGSAIRDTKVEYPDLPGYGYEYKNPNQRGAEPGRFYGPMAQDLEKTPAGASVVKNTPQGKAIDTGRLSLLNASETSKLRREVDALKAGQPMADEIRGTNAEYPMATDRGRGPVVAPTDLVFSSENGGNFRTPDEQLRYAESRRRAPQPTPLFFGEDNGGTFRTAAEQERYARRPDSADVAIARKYPSARVVSEENRVASLAKDVDQSDAILRRLRAQQAGQQPTAAAAPYSPYGY